MSNILNQIIASKIYEVTKAKQNIPLRVLEEMSKLHNFRDFEGALRAKNQSGKPGVIAEIKRASPSKGIIRSDFSPRLIAESYQKGGATCLSVLTDEQYFQGSNFHMTEARDWCSIPILRKDFMIDPYQIYEARAMGADCILLIVAALTDSHMKEMESVALSLNMSVLIETHNQEEIERALKLESRLIGINNRDLTTFYTTINTTLNLSKLIPEEYVIVTESGIHSRDDIATLREANIQNFLVGEAFMRADEPGDKLKELFSPN